MASTTNHEDEIAKMAIREDSGHLSTNSIEKIDNINNNVPDYLPHPSSASKEQERSPTALSLALSKSHYSRSPTRDFEDNHNLEMPYSKVEDTNKSNTDSDSGWDTDLEIEDECKDEFDSTGRKTYMETCQHLGVVPVSYFLRHIQDAKIRMRHHGLGPKGANAIAVPLVSNTVVISLDLTGNHVEGAGGKCIAAMLKENCYISELNLSSNKLGSQGARAVGDMLEHNTTLQRINLSANEFKDKDAEPFTQALKSNYRLKELILNNNDFSEVGGEFLGEAIASNDTLDILDLSWNHLRNRGAIAISKAMAENNSIRILDLSWNGFANEGALAMGQALKVNKQLIDLDLTNNRITNDGALAIAKGLESNDTLKVLKIGKNPISAAGAMAILMAISKNPQSALTDIRLTDIIITEEFEEMLKAIQKTRSDLRIEHGGTARHHGTNGAEIEKKSDPLQKLLDYVQKNNLRLLDLFQRFDKDKSMSVSREEFTKGIQSSNIPLKDSEINAIITMLDEDGDGEVDYGELVKGNKEILRKARERRNAKKKKEEFEERRVVEILASGVTEEERVKQVDAAWVDKEIREEMVDTGVETMRK